MRICDIFQDGDWLFNRLATTIPPDIQLKLKGLFVDPTSEDLLIRGGGVLRLESIQLGAAINGWWSNLSLMIVISERLRASLGFGS